MCSALGMTRFGKLLDRSLKDISFEAAWSAISQRGFKGLAD